MLDKTYRPEEVEGKHYENWEQKGAFKCGGEREGQETYTIVIPPPNVTGSLHMGHALNNTLQDILIRQKRMKGLDVLWQPGTDHAGIATQMVVERQMEGEGLTRHDLGRDKFIERVWDWKAESGGTITGQLRRLGASCDWSRERFTMDEGLSKAVQKVFVELHKEGLIYRDKRLVNWDPHLHTAISDLEVENKEQSGKMWYFKYPLEEDSSKHVIVGTTRPETMLGDTGVAVHPDDERYADLIGKNVVLPITGRLIPIVADEYADPEKGSGAVKITPAHDFNDFEVGRRCKLDVINILDHNACIISDTSEGDGINFTGAATDVLASGFGIPNHLHGLDRFEARDVIVKEMEGLGLLDKIEENPMTVPYGDRSGVVIEPWLLDQWFVDAKKLAVEAIKAVEDGRTTFHPKSYENTYFEWMRNIQPWCVSRQIWWGHQIPAWYGPDGYPFVEYTEEEAKAAAEKHYGESVELTRDPDVLDTWFSSALWPFSTLGWPDKTPELERYYPTDCLVTGFDIIFFWVARMMMMGLHFMKEVPFKDVYIHALVRDEKGQKMSKSKGNVIDPLTLVDKYSADALRFTLTAFAAQGRDVRMSESRVEGYRNFGTKLWNAARFCEMNECKPVEGFDPQSVSLTLNKWIVGKVAEATKNMDNALDAYRFNDAAGAIYQFTWGSFCDWYLEFAKPVFNGEDEKAKTETRATAAWVLENTLKLMHPIMPFITAELFEKMGYGVADEIIQGPWPVLGDEYIDAAAEAEMDWLVSLITGIRSVRAELNVPPGAKIPLIVLAEEVSGVQTHRNAIERLGRIDGIETGVSAPKGAVQFVVDQVSYALPIADVIDLEAEKARLEKAIGKLEQEIDRFDKKLNNANFVARAPEEVVEEQKEKREKAAQDLEKQKEALARFAAM